MIGTTTHLKARSMRLSFIQELYDQEALTEEEAKVLLDGPLAPGDPATHYDDADLLITKRNSTSKS